MSSYKDLCLNVDLIPGELKAFCGGDVSITVKGPAMHHTFTYEDKECLVLVYKKNKGGVTLQSGGKHSDLSDKAIEFLVERLVTSVDKNFSHTFKNCPSGKFDEILAYLEEDCGVKVVEKAIGREDAKAFTATGKQGDTLTFTFYNTTGTFLIQGRPLYVAAEVLNYLSADSSITQQEVLDCAGSVFGTKVGLGEVQDELARSYPFSTQFSGKRLSMLLSTAISMRGVPLILSDYSVIPFQSLRALEALMKAAVLDACGERWENFGGKFDSNGNFQYQLKADTEQAINCPVTCSLLNECYPHYRKYRHGMFHADGIDDAIVVIPDRVQAINILDTTMDMIERNCKALSEK